MGKTMWWASMNDPGLDPTAHIRSQVQICQACQPHILKDKAGQERFWGSLATSLASGPTGDSKGVKWSVTDLDTQLLPLALSNAQVYAYTRVHTPH